MSDLWRELGWRTYYIHIYVCMSRHLSLLPYSFSPLQLILIRPKYSFLLWLSGNVNLGSDRMNNHLDSCDSRNKTISERYHFPRKLLNDKIWFVDNCLNQITNQGPSIQWSTIAAMKETSWAQMVTYDRKSWKKKFLRHPWSLWQFLWKLPIKAGPNFFNSAARCFNL